MTARTRKAGKKISTPCDGLPDCRSLVIEGTEYHTKYNRKFENRKTWKAPDPKQVLSFIPGTILDIFIKEGQEVIEGEPLLILEAMKMRNVVNMPVTGKIKSINVSEGDKIPKGHLILSIE